MKKLGELERWCTICLWSSRRVRALYVASGPPFEGGRALQWFDCGEHRDEPNGHVSKLEPIGPWLAACQSVGDASTNEDDTKR